ncbi:alpha/beta fold hydrolase [Limnobacter sp.]|uniref:YheT family hydrolase n=1 Tax=Limnobacter sp. TaxID=2003368 RepID=UPI00258A6B5F|nr:alpha/beta fold hydrolase [Limnobacter sp.]
MQYQAPWWLPDGHSQTIVAAKLARKPQVAYFRQRWLTPDHDFIDLDFTEPPEQFAQFKTLWVLFHGLEGSSESHYSLALMEKAKAVGALGVVVHFRGCSGENNWQPRAYHSGDSAELDWVLPRLRQTIPTLERVHVMGVSLGGNVLLKWLGEQGSQASRWVHSAVAISAPVDLLAGAHSLAKGFNRVYTRMFLSTLVPKSVDKILKYPELGDLEKVKACKDFFDFDNLVTAPWHGFKNALDYYEKSSAKRFLLDIKTPTLMVNARNDPFMSGQYLPTRREASAAVQQMFPNQGGHVGFARANGLALGLDWLPKVCHYFFEQHV